MRYKVTVERRTIWREEIEVDADRKEQAEGLALRHAMKIEFTDCIDAERSVHSVRAVTS